MYHAGGRDRVLARVAECAVALKEALGEVGEINILRLAEYLGERSALTYQALGWLAREGRIRYRQSETQVFVSLSKTRAKSNKKGQNDQKKRR